MDEITAAKIEVSLIKILDILDKSKSLSEEKSTELVNSIKAIKLEATDLKPLETVLSAILAKVSEEEPESTDKEEIVQAINDLKKCLDDKEVPELDLTVTEVILNEILQEVKKIEIPEANEIHLPDSYPLPTDQLELLKHKPDEELLKKINKVNRLLQEIRDVTGGGGPDVVGIKNVDSLGRETRANIATEETLQSIAGLSIPAHDYIAATYPTTSQEVYTYKTGGASGTVVGVITVNYTDATKEVLSSVVKS